MVLSQKGKAAAGDSSSVGRAAASQAAGRGFEPRLSLKHLEVGHGVPASLFLPHTRWHKKGGHL